MKRALIAASLVLVGCQLQPRGLPASPSAESQALETHLARLEQQIAELERGIGTGRGTYRGGSLLRVEGDRRSEPPLERLRRLERELADTRAQLSTRESRIVELTRELTQMRDRGQELSEQNHDLTYARDALVTAQQALVERQSEVDGLRAQLATSELQRLKAEREHFGFAARLLRLSPAQTTPLLDLQEEVRESVRSLAPASVPVAPPAANPAPAAQAAPAHHGGH
jgi:DNA repair exonuclease SbcCD ATPase subunit